MDYILSGNPKEVDKVIRENRIRIQRGVIKVTPLGCEVHTDNSDVIGILQERNDVIATLQERNAELNEMFANECKEHSAACFRADELQIKLNKIQEAGVDIDLILDTPTEVADVKDAPEADTKAEPEADTKTELTEDVKEPETIVPEADTKTTKAKRTKKTE